MTMQTNGWVRLFFALGAGLTIVMFIRDFNGGHLRWS
jgi:hypothetical protein